MTLPSNSLWSDHPNHICWRVQVMKRVIIIQISRLLLPPLSYIRLFCPWYLLSTMTWRRDSRREGKGFWTEW
jgi:hypothetical protein